MGSFNTSSKNISSVYINSTLANGYIDNSDNLLLSVSYLAPEVPADTLENETNYIITAGSGDPITGQVPENIIPSLLQIKLLKSQLTDTSYVGFRLSNINSPGNSNFIFQTTNTQFTQFAEANPKPSISDKDAIPSNDQFIWSTVTNSLLDATEGYVIIPVNLNYTGSTPFDSSTFSIDVYETSDKDDTSKYEKIGSVTKTSDSPTKDLSITSYTAEISPVMSSLDPTNYAETKTDFHRYDPVVLKCTHTTTTSNGYKPISKLTIDENITSNISATDVYVTIKPNVSSTASFDNSDIHITLSSPPSGVTYANGIITLEMVSDEGSTFASLFTGDGNTLPNVFYVYVYGTITGLGA